MKKIFKGQRMNVGLGYDYTYEQWFSEFSNVEYLLFAEYMELYETNPQAFLQLLASKKEQGAVCNRLLKFGKSKRVLKTEKKEAVEQFFKEVPMARLMSDVTLMP